MNIKQLKHFVAVARSRTLTDAARTLFISQSALSMSIKNLEESLGFDLFNRRNKLLDLTENGKIMLEAADRILDGCEHFDKEAEKIRKKGKRLRVAFCDAGPYRYFVPLLAACMQEVSIESVLAENDCSVDSLLSEDFDVVIADTAFSETDICSQFLVRDETLLSIPKNKLSSIFFVEQGKEIHELEARDRKLTDLRNAEIVFLKLNGPFSVQKVNGLFKRVHPSVTIRYYGDYFIFKHVLDSENAITFTTELVRHYRQDPGDRILIPLKDEGSTIDYWVNWKKNEKNATALDHFLKTMLELASNLSTL